MKDVLNKDWEWMGLALEEAQKAFHKEEVPVGCVIVKDNKILARSHNLREELQDPTAHAEMIALKEASLFEKQWRLLDSVVYVTLEPCAMCAGALIHARIKRLVFGCRDPKSGCCGSLLELGQDKRFNHCFEIHEGVRAEESSLLLKEFFQMRRQKRRDGRVVEGA